MYCKKCGNQLGNENKFCAVCGEPRGENATLMYCRKCGNQLKNEARFCAHCGEPCGENTAQPVQPSQPTYPAQPANPYEPSTGKAFMEQPGAPYKTGAAGITQAVAQAQARAGELYQSENLNQFGGKKNLFLFACGALLLNLILLLSKTISFSMLRAISGTYSIIGFCSEMADFANEMSRYVDGATDGPFFTAVRVLVIIGIIFIVAAAVKTFLPLFVKSTGKPVSFKLLKIAVIYCVALTFLFILFCAAAYSGQDIVEFRLTFLGWVYVMESVVLIVALFRLSPKVKKNGAGVS